MIQDAGIDVNIFRPPSVRSATASTACIPVDTIIRTVGWTKDSVFRKYYNKPISMDVEMSRKLMENYK